MNLSGSEKMPSWATNECVQHCLKLEIANIQFLVSSTLERPCEKWFDSGGVLKIEQWQLPVDWTWNVRMKLTTNRFIYSM